MGKRICSDIENADELVQNDVQLEQHEEAHPKKKAKGLELVSCGAICEQTSAVLCDLWHQSQVFEPENVKRFAKNGWAKRGIALKLATDKIASFMRVTQTESLRSQSGVCELNT